MRDVLITAAIAAIILGGIITVLYWRYVPPKDLPGPVRDSSALGDYGLVSQLGSTPSGTTGNRAGESSPDDDWADQLHAMNQLGKLGDLTRPVHEQTHYEIEATIAWLGVADWLPGRVAA